MSRTAKLTLTIIVLSGFAGPVAAEFAFAPYASYALPGWGDGWAVAFGDFDHDGDLDMAASSDFNPVDGTISVFSNDGMGQFTGPAAYSTGGTGPTGITAVDLNNDTWPDLAYCLFSPGSNVKVLINNQNGGFTATQTLYSGNAVWITAGDFNGDGWPDVVSTNSQISGGTARVFLNNGAGSLLNGINYPVAFMPLGVAAVDLDDDEDIDLAVASRNTDLVSVLKNNGDGTFAPMQNHAVGETPQFIAADDLDNDGSVDLAVSSTGISFTSDVSVLFNNGTGGIEPQITHQVGYDATGIVAEDLDNDGDKDLAVVVEPQSRVFVLENNGDGTFVEPVTFPCGQPGDTSRAISAGDLNGDGRIDLAVSNLGINGSVAVLINQTPTLVAGDIDADGTVGPQDLALLLGSWGACGGCFADLNVDGSVGPSDLALLLGNWS